MKPILFSTPMVQAILAGRKTQTRRVAKPHVKTPYQIGNILWVRETWAIHSADYFGHADGTQSYVYRADGDRDEIRWRPSIFMPKSAARIYLQVRDLRIETLHSITEEEAIAEGVGLPGDYQAPEYYFDSEINTFGRFISAYAGLWDKLNAKRGYGWDTNPTVWVIEFKRIEAPER